MRMLEINFRVYDTNRQQKEFRETRVLNLDQLRNSKVSLEEMASEYAKAFWHSIVLMGVMDD